MDIQEFLEAQEHNHMVLVHEESTIGHVQELEFIKDGLEKGEVGVYITNDIMSTKNHMEEIGIKVNQFEEENKLHLIETPKIFKEYEKVILDLVNDVEKYGIKIRLVSTHNYDFSLKENIDSMLEIEQDIDDAFSKIPGNMICSFSLSTMNKDQSKEFVTKLLDSHHSVVILRKDGTSKGFSLP